MSEITHDTIKVAVTEGLEEFYEKRQREIAKMCEQNIEIAMGRHREKCPGANKGNMTGMSGLGIGVSLIIERVFSYLHKGG